MSLRRSNVTRNAALVGSLTAVSRVLGLVREMLTAKLFGTSLAQSAFVVAFQIPNLFRRLFGEGALSAAFVPAFSHSLTNETQAEAALLARRVVTLLACLLTAIVALGIITAWVVMPAVEPGGRMALTLPLLRIMLPYAVFICLAAILMGMLNVLGDFSTPALAPTLLNVVWIGTLAGICPWLPEDIWIRVVAVAWSIVVAGVLQLAFLWNALRRRGWSLRPQWDGLRDERVRGVWRRALPAALGAGVVQINVCLDAGLALWAAPWAPSALTYADRILYLPMGVVATAFGTVLLPTFSRQFSEGKLDDLKATVTSALSDLTFLMIPATAGLVLLAPQIVAVLYQRGEFVAEDTMRTARALACYAPGLVIFSIHKVFNPLFHSMRDTRTPMYVSAGVVALNLVLNITFILTWPLEWKHAGIAVSTVISSAVACVILARLAVLRLGRFHWRGPVLMLFKSLLAAVLMACLAHQTHAALSGWLPTGSTMSSVVALGGAIGVAAVVYLGLMALLSYRETRLIVNGLRRRLQRRRRA